MPYFPNQKEEENKKQQGSVVQLNEGSGEIIPGSNEISSNQASSTGFTNINRYLEQNKPQAQELSNQVAGKITENVNKADNALKEAPNQINQYIQSNLPQDNGLIDQAKKDPTAIAQDQTKLEQFKSLKDAKYTGSSDFIGSNLSQPIQDYISGAKNYQDIVDNQSTRTRALQDIQKNDSAGITSLNNLLLQNDPNSKETLNNAVEPIGELDNRYTEVENQFNSSVQGANNTAQQYRDRIQNEFLGENGVVNQFKSDLDKRVADTRKAASENTDNLSQLLTELTGGTSFDLFNRKFTDNQLADLGINRNQLNTLRNKLTEVKDNYTWSDAQRYSTPDNYVDKYEYLYDNLDLNQWLNSQNPNNSITRDNVATAEDYAKQAALQELLGIDNSYIMDQTQAGKASSDLVEFDYDSAISAIDQAIKELKNN